MITVTVLCQVVEDNEGEEVLEEMDCDSARDLNPDHISEIYTEENQTYILMNNGNHYQVKESRTDIRSLIQQQRK